MWAYFPHQGTKPVLCSTCIGRIGRERWRVEGDNVRLRGLVTSDTGLLVPSRPGLRPANCAMVLLGVPRACQFISGFHSDKTCRTGVESVEGQIDLVPRWMRRACTRYHRFPALRGSGAGPFCERGGGPLGGAMHWTFRSLSLLAVLMFGLEVFFLSNSRDGRSCYV